MSTQKDLVCIVTGAGTGFGALIARSLALAGHTVYSGLRHQDDSQNPSYDECKEFSKQHNCKLIPIQLDVVRDESIHAAVDRIIKEQGRIDVMVHNAGHMSLGVCEAFTPEQYLEMFETNTLSCVRINRVILPHMRERRSGFIVWISSSSAHGPGSPFLGPYFAAKAAQDSLAQTYALEVSQWGIDSCIVVPGVFTKGTAHFSSAMPPQDKEIEDIYMAEGAPYHGWDKVCLDGSAAMAPPDADPQWVADAVVKAVAEPRGKKPFRLHIEPEGPFAEQVNAVRDRVRAEFLDKMGCAELIEVKL